jgi:hypothetical protein
MLRIRGVPVGAFAFAVLVAYLLGAVLATQVILGELRGMGMSVTLTDHLNAMVHDLRGLASSYLPLIVIAFAIGLSVAGLIGRRLPGWRHILYPLAGAGAIVALHLIVKAVLGLNGIAAVRPWYGLALQGLAGWLGGYAFLMGLGLARR